jgi:hypothetical protein
MKKKFDLKLKLKNIFNYYFGKNKTDTISLLLAYNCALIFTNFMIWSYETYGIWNASIWTYLTTFGGLI